MILVAIPALLLAAASLAGFLGGLWWPLDLLASFRPQYAAVLTLLAAVLIGFRWRRIGLVVLGAGLVNVIVLVPFFLPVEPPLPGAAIRVLSFNLFASNQQFDEVTGFIAGSGADVVFLHEASRPWEEAVEAADLGYTIVKTRADDLIFGTLVLHKEAASVVSRGFGISEPRAVEVELGGLAILAIHPLAPTTAQRAALRDAQMRFAGDWAADRSGPKVVVGDFNASPWSHSFRTLLRAGGLENSQRGRGLDASFPATGSPLLRIPIDHLLHGEKVGIVDRRLGPALGSDHFPLIVDLAVTG